MARKSKRMQIREEMGTNVKPIKKPRKKRTLTEEQKAALVERMAKAREAKGPNKNLSIHESIRDLPAEHSLHPDKVKGWIKEQKDLLQGLGRDAKNSSDPNIRRLYWDTETYVFNLQRYLNDGIYRDHRYGAEKQSTLRLRSVRMSYYPDGTPKRTPGVFYPDIGEEYTNEMAAEDHASAQAKRVSNKKRVRQIN